MTLPSSVLAELRSKFCHISRQEPRPGCLAGGASRASRPPRSGAAPRAAAGPLAELRRLQEGNGSSQFPPGSRLLSLNFAPSREEGVEGCEGRFEEILESQEPLAIKQKTAKEVNKNLIGCGSIKLRGDEKKGRAKAGAPWWHCAAHQLQELWLG